MLIFRRVAAIFLFLFIALPLLLAPVYRFPMPQPFAGASLWNPYAHLAGTFAKWQLPDRYEFLDALPRTSTGKFWKTKLRERFGS